MSRTRPSAFAMKETRGGQGPNHLGPSPFMVRSEFLTLVANGSQRVRGLALAGRFGKHRFFIGLAFQQLHVVSFNVRPS